MSEPHKSLVEQATRGDSVAVDELLAQHLPALRAYIRLHSDELVRDRESCTDLAQSVCREVLGSMEAFEYRGEAPFRKWLYQKALSKIVDRQRHWLTDKRNPAHESRRAASSPDVYASFISPSRVAIGREEIEQLERAFDKLPDDYRQVITLSRVIGMSHTEIASEMDREEGAVRVLLHRALVRLAMVMNRKGEGEG